METFVGVWEYADPEPPPAEPEPEPEPEPPNIIDAKPYIRRRRGAGAKSS